MTSRPAVSCEDTPAGRGPAACLLRQAERMEQLADERGERAAELLRPAAAALRKGADLYRVDPTLEGDPAGRERPLDLLAELGRQLLPLVRNAGNGRDHPRWPTWLRWEEAEALAARFPVVLGWARMRAYLDHASPERCRELSALWLANEHQALAKAARILRSATERALSLPHPAPAAVELALMATALEEHAATQARRRDEDLEHLDRMHAEPPG